MMMQAIPCPRGCGATFVPQPQKLAEILHECPNSRTKKRYAAAGKRELIVVYVGKQHTGEEVRD